MVLEEKIAALAKLGEYLDQLIHDEGNGIYQMVEKQNPWFIPAFVKTALIGIRKYSERKTLEKWVEPYHFNQDKNKRIGLILAGNIPLVGFHDLLCVLVSGHTACLKPSHQDQVLTDHLIDKILEIEPGFRSRINKVSAVEHVDAVIATGSDNSARYFYAYFHKLPHLIRKNRTSVAVLDGNESATDLAGLSRDIFLYFGMGCRNISKIFIPRNYDPSFLLKGLKTSGFIGDHLKYRNNYLYQRSLSSMLDLNYLDGGYYLLQESEKLISPVGVIHYSRYRDLMELQEILGIRRDKIQAIVSNLPGLDQAIPFGRVQFPEPWDYADQVDTLKFLLQL
ncbi:MAG: acyl-CoA reductase [Cyclobacteriaceae bacterium]|nr:acyl-CoA reductase [Cyclobacteriaceae bacterium]